MDITLREYLKLADETHEYVDKFGIVMKEDQLEEKIILLQSSIKNIQAIAKRIADVSNVVNGLIHIKKYNQMKYIDPKPTSNDHSVLRVKYPEEKHVIIDDITLPIKTVYDLNEIPIGNIYYVEKYKQYCVDFLGVKIKGSLANIVNYNCENSARCEYGIECKSFKNKDKKCKYYHDREDYIKLSLPIPNDIRNFTVGSFLYSAQKRPKAYFTRHIGDRSNIKRDLLLLKKRQYLEEINNREGQLMHDILIYMILHREGLLEKYTHWKQSVSFLS